MKFLDQEKRRQLLNERHSCKMFDSHYEFSSEELEEIAEIARLSPSSYNTQPWRFVIVTNKDVKKQIAAHSYFNEEMIKSASALMVVCPLRPSELLPHSHYMQNLYPESYKVRVIPSFAQMLGVRFNHSMQKLESYNFRAMLYRCGANLHGRELNGIG
ncbi:hypothetical protein VN0861_11280 [Helicobacter pylori]